MLLSSALDRTGRASSSFQHLIFAVQQTGVERYRLVVWDKETLSSVESREDVSLVEAENIISKWCPDRPGLDWYSLGQEEPEVERGSWQK